MTDPGLTPTYQVPASAVAVIDVADRPVSDLWHEIFDSHHVREALISAILARADGKTYLEVHDELEDLGIDVDAGAYRSLVAKVAAGDSSALTRLIDRTRTLGEGHSGVEDILAVAQLFDTLEDTPTIAFVFDREFEQRERRSRVPVCQLIATLAQAFDVRFVAPAVTQAFVRDQHRDHLPGVSEWRVTDQDMGPRSDAVESAIRDLDPDGREVRLLRELADCSSETMSYGQLYGTFPEIEDSRVRQTVGHLEDADLVSRFGPQSSRKVELRETGSRVLEVLDAEIGRQQHLEESVKNFEKPPTQCRVTPRTGEGGEDGAQPYRVEWMGAADHAAAVAPSSSGAVSLVSGPLPAVGTRTHEVSYDEDADQAVVAVEATEPLPYLVSTAVALTAPWFVDDVLSVSRLEAIDEPGAILRQARCIGGLSSEVLEDRSQIRDVLVEWGQKIQDLTVDLHNGDYDDRDEFRAEIMRSAHGLIGSVVHLFDAVGVDLVQEVRIPGGADLDDLEELVVTLGISTSIRSAYNGVYNGHRQLYEDRPEKRSSAFTAEVDAANPHGRLIDAIVLRGPDVHRIRPALERRFESPRDLHDDAPEFSIPIAIEEPGREAIAAVLNDVLLPKRIQPTEAAVSICHALVSDPYHVANAVQQLQPEDQPREVRPDELRYALSVLGPDAILPDLPPTVGKIVLALLTAEQPLSQSELAEAADVSTVSIRNHEDRLEALGLLDTTDGYRLALSFRTSEERATPIVPSTLGGRFTDAVDALLLEKLPPERYGDPEDDLGGLLFWLGDDDPPDPWGVADENDDLEPWVDLAGRLTGADRPDHDENVVRMGPKIAQRPLSSFTEVSS